MKATEESERGHARSQRAWMGALTSVGVKALGSLLNLAITPFVFARLGKELFGVWAVIASLLAWLSLADLGVLRRLQADLGAAQARADHESARSAIGTTLALLTVVGLAVSAIGFLVVGVVPWASVLGLAADDEEIARVTARVAFATFAVSLPISAVWAAFTALQRGWQANVLSSAGTLVGFALTLAVLRFTDGPALPLFFAASAAGGITAGFCGLIVLLRSAWASSAFARVSLRLARLQLSGGAPFLLTQAAALAINESQILAITHFQGASEAGQYAIYARLQALAAFLLNAIDVPLGAAYREAYVRGDKAWLAATFRRYQALKLAIAVLLAVAGVLFGGVASRFLSGGEVSVPPHVWALSGTLLVTAAWTGGFLNLFFVFDRTRELALTVVVNAAFTIVLVLLGSAHYSIPGAIAGTTAFSLFVGTWWMPWLLRKELRDVGLLGRAPP